MRHLYAPHEQEGGNTRRATDPFWSVDTFAIKKSIKKDGEPIVREAPFYILLKHFNWTDFFQT